MMVRFTFLLLVVTLSVGNQLKMVGAVDADAAEKEALPEPDLDKDAQGARSLGLLGNLGQYLRTNCNPTAPAPTAPAPAPTAPAPAPTAPAPPPGVCTNPIPFTGTLLSGTTAGAAEACSFIASSCRLGCSPYQAVFYTFTPSSSTNFEFQVCNTVAGDTTLPEFYLHSNSDCGNLQCSKSLELKVPSPCRAKLYTLTAQAEYIISVSFGDVGTTFSLNLGG